MTERGFSLIETLVAAMLIIVALVLLVQLFLISAESNQAARSSTAAAVIAQQKMEQLRALAWGFDALGLPQSDEGLARSPAGTIARNIGGYCDFLDEGGRGLGGGVDPPLGTTYVRRWSIELLPANPDNTLILQVRVTRRDGRGEARMVGVKTRKAG